MWMATCSHPLDRQRATDTELPYGIEESTHFRCTYVALAEDKQERIDHPTARRKSRRRPSLRSLAKDDLPLPLFSSLLSVSIINAVDEIQSPMVFAFSGVSTGARVS